MHRRVIAFTAFLYFAAVLSELAAVASPPDPPREFRGVWVATVRNMDWPSKKGLSTEEQKTELQAIFDKAAELRLNAIIFQVRPMSDALYASKLEPWSEFLTGTLGQAPSPAYDPLELAVQEAHARGLELHAWFNPYRALNPAATSPIPENHVIKRRPDLAKPYGKHFWLNPTSQEVEDYTVQVILDVVRRYDIDGVHLDDYFFPYHEKGADGKVISFPDDDTWAKYQAAGGKLSRDDWRRDAIDRLIQRLHREVKAAKPWVKFGVSPIGIWRPGNPPGVSGFDAYTQIYADSRLWLQSGWCDYFAPQLYWRIAQQKQSFPRLLEWWSDQNTRDTLLWPGLYTGLVTGKKNGWPASEIIDQIKLTRAQRGVSGQIHFSMRTLMADAGGIDEALKTVYAERALVPAIPLVGHKPPSKPSVRWEGSATVLTIRAAEEGIRLFVVRTRRGNEWRIRIEPAGGNAEARLRFDERQSDAVVSAIDRMGAESEKVELAAP